MNRTIQYIVLAFVLAAAPAEAGTLAGTIRAIGGPGLQGPARVRLSRLGEPVADQFAGSDGQFRFDNVEPGVYDISVETLNYGGFTMQYTVMGSVFDVVLELRPRSPTEQSRTATRARQEFERGLAEQKKGNAKAAVDHLKKAAALGSREAEVALRQFPQ